MEAMAMSVFSKFLQGGNFITVYYNFISFGQNVALVMVNKFVKFDEKSLSFVKSYGRDMLKIGHIWKSDNAPQRPCFLTK